MANPENLRTLSPSEAREQGRKGGIASGKARRERKAFAEAFEVLLKRDFTDQNGNRLQGVDAIAAKTFQAAMNGDLKAMQIIRDTVGEQPVQRVEVDTIPKETYERVMSVLEEED